MANDLIIRLPGLARYAGGRPIRGSSPVPALNPAIAGTDQPAGQEGRVLWSRGLIYSRLALHLALFALSVVIAT